MNPVLVTVLRVLAALGLLLLNGVVLIYMLRKVLGHLHLRLGPMELGPRGAFQTLADVLKLLTKESVRPTFADLGLFFVAPAIVFVPSLAAYAAIPFSRSVIAADLDMGLLFTFAVLSLVPLGVVAAGWSSYNKLALFGATRAVAQLVTYEVPLLLSALPVVMIAGSLNLVDIVRYQQDNIWFLIPAFPAFVLYLIAGLVESNQTPFDMSEAESELITGYANEYSSMKFGMLFLAEFSNSFIFSALIVTLFLGGWTLPFVPDSAFSPLVFMVKVYLVIFVLMWIRGTLPRVRIDHMLSAGWKVMLPCALAWIVLTGVGIKVFPLVFGGVR